MTAKQTFVTALETYTVVKQIGCGGAGKVYEVTSSDGTTFALKHMDGLNGSTQRGKRARNEMSFLLRAKGVVSPHRGLIGRSVRRRSYSARAHRS